MSTTETSAHTAPPATDVAGGVSASADTMPADTSLSSEQETQGLVVIDTCVLVDDPDALLQFTGDDVVLPLTVIEELDGLKVRDDDVGRAARTVLRKLEQLRAEANTDLRSPIELTHGGTVRVEPNGLHLAELDKFHLDATKADNRILAAALGLKAADAQGRQVKVVSNDTAVRIKAAQFRLATAEHRLAEHTTEAYGPGWGPLHVSGDTIDKLFEQRHVEVADLTTDVQSELSALGQVRGVQLQAAGQSALARVRVASDGRTVLTPVKDNQRMYGLRPRSAEQRFALDLLADPDTDVVALVGPAGTGKTLLALAAGLELVSQGEFDRVSVYRPTVAVGGEDLGYLPGDLDEKLAPWAKAIVDAFSALSNERPKQTQHRFERLVQDGKLTTEAISHLRGRSLARSFIIIDEAQNMSAATLKTVLTRIADGSKVVFTGDTSQIDAPWLNSRSNALAVLLEKFNDEQLFGHVQLEKCERGRVADLAAAKL